VRPQVSWLTRAISATSAIVVFFLSEIPSFAQSCALCYNNVAASKPSFIAGLRHGILILLVPPLAICFSIGMMTYRRRNRYNENSGEME
jgi:hypothetical protein